METFKDLGYDAKLYILAFDLRGSFQKKMFGIEGDPTPEQTATISDAKHLIFEGMVKAVERGGVDPHAIGVLVDEQFGGDIPHQAKQRDLKLAMPVEKSGQDMFDFEYGERFGEHIESFDPHFSKVLVRYNPEGDADANRDQAAKLRRLSEWLHEHDRKFLFELLVPAEPAQLEAAGGDTDRYEAALRPELEQAFVEETHLDRTRRASLRRAAKRRSRQRAYDRRERSGAVRFIVLTLTLIMTAVLVTVVMFKTLYVVMG